MTRTRDYLPKHARLISLAERVFTFAPRNGVMAPAIAALGGKRAVTVTFLPAISDAAVLADLVYRSSWYLSPVVEKIRGIIFPVAVGIGPGERDLPPYLDEETAQCRRQLLPLFEFREIGSLDDERGVIADADIVLVWDSRLWDPPAQLSNYGVFRRGGRTFFNVDRQTYAREASTWLDVPRLLGACRSAVVAQCREKFIAMAKTLGNSPRAYVFGTGPSL